MDYVICTMNLAHGIVGSLNFSTTGECETDLHGNISPGINNELPKKFIEKKRLAISHSFFSNPHFS
jgi:hypothetical protein